LALRGSKERPVGLEHIVVVAGAVGSAIVDCIFWQRSDIAWEEAGDMQHAAVALSHGLLPEKQVEVPDGIIQKIPQMCDTTSHGSLSDEKTHAYSGSAPGSGMSLVSGRRGNSDTRSHTVPGTCDDQKKRALE